MTLRQMEDYHDWCENNGLPILPCFHLLQSESKQPAAKMSSLWEKAIRLWKNGLLTDYDRMIFLRRAWFKCQMFKQTTTGCESLDLEIVNLWGKPNELFGESRKVQNDQNQC